MSTLFFFLVAVLLIFLRPPFETPDFFKKIFRPIVLIILMVMLLFIGAVKSLTTQNQPLREAIKIEANDTCFQETWAK